MSKSGSTEPLAPVGGSKTDYDRLGGADGLRPLVAAFIERVYADVIIGFHFTRVDKAQLIEREIEFAAAHLGGPKNYRGRPIPQAHRQHPINSGHFHRRLHLLDAVLREHGVAEDIIERWLTHNRALEKGVTNGTNCVD